jgi:hypothetical protein
VQRRWKQQRLVQVVGAEALTHELILKEARKAKRNRHPPATAQSIPDRLLEALDRDVRKEHEQPSIGVLLCASKNDEIVEYALSRSLSPALIAEYQTKLPDKKLLQAKLQEFYLQDASEEDEGISKPKAISRRKRPV